MKYQYHLKTWGGFYNDQWKEIHGKEEGDFIFDTLEERQNYIDELRAIEKSLNAQSLVLDLSEGYNCHIRTVIHRVIEFKGKEYYTNRDLGVNFPYSAAKYIMDYKWTPGFNDYPLGEKFDYSKVAIKSEWVTGAFNIEDHLY